jgi:hypothetical protein
MSTSNNAPDVTAHVEAHEGRSKTGKYCVDKGKRFERELVRLFAAATPNARIGRGFQFRSGADAPDVDLPGFWLEAKVGAKTNPRKAMRQAMAATRYGRWPLAVCKDDRQEPLCVMNLSDFVTFYSQWFAGRIGVPANSDN